MDVGMLLCVYLILVILAYEGPWPDRLAYLTGWLNLSLSLPRTIGLKPDVAVTSTHNDHIHVHIHQPQMCKLECSL